MSVRRGSQSGVALLSVLLVVALATVTAVAMAVRHQVDIRRSANLLDAERARQYALGVEGLALGRLAADRDEKGVDGALDAWAQPIGPVDLGEARVAGQVEDLQGRLNLNGLLKDGEPDALQVARFDRLLDQLGLKVEIRQALLDWLDPDSEPRDPGGAEDDVYLRAEPPRRAGNGPLAHTSELRLVAGVGATEYARLAPYVTVLPELAPVNLNSAPLPVLMALAKGVAEGDARSFLKDRGRKPFETVEEALRHDAFAGLGPDPSGLSVGSRFFRVRSAADVGRGRARIAALAQRPEGQAPTVLARERDED
jgi:general secretion pathway protein K